MRGKQQETEKAYIRGPSVLRVTVWATLAWFILLGTVTIVNQWPLKVMWLTSAMPVFVLFVFAWQEWGLHKMSIAAWERKLMIDINRDGVIGANHPPDFTVTIQNPGGARLTIFDGRKADASAIAAALVAHSRGIIRWSTSGVKAYLNRREFEDVCEWLQNEGWLENREGKGRVWTPEGEAFLQMVVEKYG